MPKTSAKEIQRRKAAARRPDVQHRIEAKKPETKEQGLSERQIRNTLGAWLPPKKDAALEFIVNLILSPPPTAAVAKPKTKAKRGSSELNRRWDSIYDALDRALIELLRSDIPLDDQTRRWIATSFHRRAFRNPESVTKSKRRVEANFVAYLKRLAKGRAETALEAEWKVAEALGLKDVDSLRKRIRRIHKIIQPR
jgi:hypothetical protein